METSQMPLRQVLEYTQKDDGTYEFKFPPSVCFGVVVSGGIVTAAIHRAAVDFVSRDSRSASFANVIHTSVNFHRPTLPYPKQTIIKLEASNVTKVGVTLHVQVMQGKLCINGYVTMGVFTQNSFVGAGHALSPAPISTSISKLESDDDDNWIAYDVPFAVAGNRAAGTYLKWFFTKTMQSPTFVDHWFTPAWKDDGVPYGAVWTNELIHFLVDCTSTLWLDPALRIEVYKNTIRAGLRQRQARRQGSATTIDETKEVHVPLPYMAASLFITTAIKKLLPPEGTKWVFMRTTTTGHASNRIDYSIVLMDAEGAVIATSTQVMMLIPLSGKEARL